MQLIDRLVLLDQCVNGDTERFKELIAGPLYDQAEILYYVLKKPVTEAGELPEGITYTADSEGVHFFVQVNGDNQLAERMKELFPPPPSGKYTGEVDGILAVINIPVI